MAYGVTPAGFVRKRLPEVLSEIEESARNIFGPGVIQTPQSPMGQLNEHFALLADKLWQVAEGSYQSYDPDQAEGIDLERLAKIRLMVRALGEPDEDFRQAITNAGRGRIDIQDLVRAVRNVPGVTYTQVFLNDRDVPDENGIGGHSLAVAVMGTFDYWTLAGVIRDYVVPGVGTYGNVPVDAPLEGYCRRIYVTVPAIVPVHLSVRVRLRKDPVGCPPPSESTIGAGLAEALNNDPVRRLINGDDVTAPRVRAALESLYPTVEFVSAKATRSDDPLALLPVPMAINFFEIARFTANNTEITVIP